ncbi:hypothetical protein KFK09_006275 [Dendrobium nobile]|uniref:Uncharacterized protein n=1 Tax=Dendrobium nobile TaxID=94219 RepID=A0A8T3BR70_DENNO|nr:hypothetical protein KFK09_006275 [Dendrobium nobile]
MGKSSHPCLCTINQTHAEEEEAITATQRVRQKPQEMDSNWSPLQQQLPNYEAHISRLMEHSSRPIVFRNQWSDLLGPPAENERSRLVETTSDGGE